MLFETLCDRFCRNKQYPFAEDDYLILDCEIESRKGIYKECNEDSFLVNDINSMSTDGVPLTVSVNTSSVNMFAICDGITSGGRGKEASQMVVHMLDMLQKDCCNVKNKELFGLFLNKVDNYIQKINSDIFVSLSNDDSNKGGSTLALLIVFKNQVAIYNVGDSRIYRMRDGLLIQLTKDHTVAAYKRQLGFGDNDPYITNKDENTLYQCLGQEKDIDMYKYGPFILNKQDRLLICSDGISGILKRNTISSILKQHSAHVITTLIEQATIKGSLDDKTAIFIVVR